jgi:hypothetical protein
MWGSGLRSTKKVANFIPDGRHIRTSNRASRGDNYYKNCIRIRIRIQFFRPLRARADIVPMPHTPQKTTAGWRGGAVPFTIAKNPFGPAASCQLQRTAGNGEGKARGALVRQSQRRELAAAAAGGCGGDGPSTTVYCRKLPYLYHANVK